MFSPGGSRFRGELGAQWFEVGVSPPWNDSDGYPKYEDTIGLRESSRRPHVARRGAFSMRGAMPRIPSWAQLRAEWRQPAHALVHRAVHTRVRALVHACVGSD